MAESETQEWDDRRGALELPPELHHVIIDHLRDDKPTLMMCSLVCSAWNASTRRPIFHALKVSPRNLGDLSSMLDTSQRMRSTIETLSVSWASSLKGAALARTPFQFKPIIELQSFYELLVKLSELRTLSLQQVAFTGSHALILLSTAARLKLQHFDIEDSGDLHSTIWDLLNLMSLFKEIESVRLSRITLDMMGSDIDEQVAETLSQDTYHPLVITNLTIDDCRRAVLLVRSVQESARIGSLNLCVDSQDVQDARDLGKLVRAAKMDLTRIKITLRWFPGFELVMSDFTSFGLSQRLESVHFRVLIADKATNQFGLIAVWDACAGILRCSPPSVREVTLEFALHGELVDYIERSDYIDWEVMREALHSLSGLRKVTVEFKSLARGATLDFKGSKAVIRERLADFDSAGMLEMA